MTVIKFYSVIKLHDVLYFCIIVGVQHSEVWQLLLDVCLSVSVALMGHTFASSISQLPNLCTGIRTIDLLAATHFGARLGAFFYSTGYFEKRRFI